MSWDLMAFKVPPEFKTTKDMPQDWRPASFGTQEEVASRLKNLLPGIRFDPPNPKFGLWGLYAGNGFSLEISLGETESVDHLWIAVRGDMKALALLAEIVAAFGLRGVDLQRGEFFDPVEARKSFGEWRSALDRYRNERLGPG